MAIAAPKKPSAPKKAKSSPSHPPFAEMITDAIVSLKERNGSSQYAITKFIEEKHKQLPSSFRKLLLFYLKKSVGAGKLVKVKNSFKLPPTRSAPVRPSAAAEKAKTTKAVSKAKAASKPKPKAAAKHKAAAKPKAVAKSKTAAKPKVAVKPKAKPAAKVARAARASKKASPGKKAAVKKVKSRAKKAASRKA